MKAFLLGAGASRGTVGTFRVPVAAEFGETLAALDPCWNDHYPALALVVEHLGLSLDPAKWSLEPVWSCIDYYAKLQASLPLPKPWRDESPQIKKALLAVYGQRCDDEADRTADDSTLSQLFQNELQAGDVLISFNYDTIAERLAQKWRHQLAAVPRDGSGVVKLAKPHGSTSWILDLTSRSVTWLSHDGQPILSSLSASDVDCGREPLVLGAVHIKSELIREVQELGMTRGVFDAISTQWRAVVEAIRDADTIFVVGYSFPREDQYGRFLVREGLRLRTGSPRIEFFEVEDRGAERAREIFNVFEGHVRELVFRGPVQPGGRVNRR